MTQNQKKTDGHSLQDRIESELADSFDEELEMEIDDDRLAKLLAQTADHPEREELDRRVYFKELFRLQGAPHARQDERPGELDSGSRVIAGRGNRDRQMSASGRNGIFSAMLPTCRPGARSCCLTGAGTIVPASNE
jgi:hypothetical protein